MHAPNLFSAVPVLVLDDDSFMLGIMRNMLTDLGVSRIRTESRPQEGLLTLNMRLPRQLVICDINMPDMNGVEVIRHLAQNNYAGAVVMLSGEDDSTLKIIAKCGQDHHLRMLGALEKPIDPQGLSGFLHSLLEPDVGKDEARIVAWPAVVPEGVGVAQTVFDAHALMRTLGGKPELRARMLDTFKIHARQRASDLEACVSNGEIQRASHIAYNLKAVARNVGAMHLGTVCQAFEAAGKAGDLAACQRMSGQLVESVRMTLGAMPRA